MEKVKFRIEELDCTEECNLLRKALLGVEGVSGLDFDILGRKMAVSYDPKKIDSRKLLSLIQSTGLSGSIWHASEAEKDRSFWQRRGRLLLCIASGLLLGLGMAFGSSLFYLAAIAAGGWFVLPKALQSLRRLNFDIHFLMVIAVIGAISIDQTFEGAAVTFLFSVALLLESWSVERARNAISALLDLSPKLARVIMDKDTLTEKRVEEVQLGERVLIRPGEKVPLDGEVLVGSSSINQAPITGEAMPVGKTEGDPVFAGTINEEGSLEVRVTKSSEDSTLARIIAMVEEARTRRAASEKWVDKFSRVYTPIMMGLALLMAIAPPLLFNEPWSEWIYRGLVLLVIACPCALVISTPVTVVSGLTSAARAGVLIKGGIFLESAANIDAIAYDKTGTLSLGKPKVQRIVPLNGHTEKELLAIAAALESGSDHPLARAILEKALEMGLEPASATTFQVFKGLGAEGDIDGKRFWIGSHRFMHEKKRKESEEAHETALAMEDEGHSVVAIGDFTHICGLISIQDEPRPLAKKTLQALHELGIETQVMLTGDNLKTAATLAKEIGIDAYFSELLPEDKLEKMEELKKEYGRVAMVGDGVNDAPAMAASTLGIAMGAMGTDAAFETADIVLMTDDLAHLPWLVRHARRTLKVIKQNIAFSLLIKAVFITLALFGLATLWMAIAADTGASLLVVLSGLRLIKGKA